MLSDVITLLGADERVVRDWVLAQSGGSSDESIVDSDSKHICCVILGNVFSPCKLSQNGFIPSQLYHMYISEYNSNNNIKKFH